MSANSSGSEMSTEDLGETAVSPINRTFSENSETYEESEDDFITSDEELLSGMISNDESRHHFGQSSTLADHTEYFAKSISTALESLSLDKSLVAQAQLSGQINNRNQQLLEVNQQLCERLESLRQRYEIHVARNKLGGLEKDLDHISARIETLKKGSKKSILFGGPGSLGMAEKYPIEYNMARDKVLERTGE